MKIRMQKKGVCNGGVWVKSEVSHPNFPHAHYTTTTNFWDRLKRLEAAQKHGLAGNRTLDHSHAIQFLEEMEMLREYYTTKPQAQDLFDEGDQNRIIYIEHFHRSIASCTSSSLQ
jgi:hypothetical protein